MFFDKKEKKFKKCEGCGTKTDEKYSYCPECGNSFLSQEKEEDFGLLGKNDVSASMENSFSQSFGITDKLVSSIMNSMMKNLDKQFKDMEKDMQKEVEGAEVKNFPNGIRIKIAGPYGTKQISPQRKQKVEARVLDENQIKKISSLPKAKAKTNVKRIGDKVFYELTTPGVSSPQDVFISKLESGYEVKAIGNKKVYVNSVPINLPLKRYSVMKNKLLVEFAGHENNHL